MNYLTKLGLSFRNAFAYFKMHYEEKNVLTKLKFQKASVLNVLIVGYREGFNIVLFYSGTNFKTVSVIYSVKTTVFRHLIRQMVKEHKF